jgi:4-amino-4-deoxy-L-arabinose transferase-like glycosyltransferase
MTNRSSTILHITLLVLLCGVLYFPYLGQVPFFDKGEPREALAVQDIVRRGEWLVPLKRATDIPSKPPLFHWSAALTSRLTGQLNESTIRFPSALYASLGVLVIYLLARRLFGAEVALMSGAILATMLVYQTQALSARVDMTLCFVVTLSLALFYSLYRGFLIHPIWYYVFYALVGIGTLAKGPLGILLPALVAGTFVVLKRKWHVLAKFCLHPGILLMVLLGAGWYVIAVTRGGEGFLDRQILQENLNRFVGGSGHSHPVYYYIPYLFSQGLPWTLFLPFVLWDSFRRFSLSRDDTLFFQLWFLVMFAFFSIAMGKRPVYLLPLYPALSVLTGAWFCEKIVAFQTRLVLYRAIAAVAAVVGLVLLVITIGGLWNHEPGWFFSPIEGLLKPKDRANLIVVQKELATFGWSFTLVSLLSAALWLSLAQCLWVDKLKAAAHRMVLISILMAFVARGVVIPEIAQSRSYREFMARVNQLVKPGDRLYLYGERFNSDPVVFYRGSPIESLVEEPQTLAAEVGKGRQFVIMSKKSWDAVQGYGQSLPPPLLTSEGRGPEGDAPLVLVEANLAEQRGNRHFSPS